MFIIRGQLWTKPELLALIERMVEVCRQLDSRAYFGSK